LAPRDPERFERKYSTVSLHLGRSAHGRLVLDSSLEPETAAAPLP
jgi:hypothetical protein